MKIGFCDRYFPISNSFDLNEVGFECLSSNFCGSKEKSQDELLRFSEIRSFPSTQTIITEQVTTICHRSEGETWGLPKIINLSLAKGAKMLKGHIRQDWYDNCVKYHQENYPSW